MEPAYQGGTVPQRRTKGCSANSREAGGYPARSTALQVRSREEDHVVGVPKLGASVPQLLGSTIIHPFQRVTPCRRECAPGASNDPDPAPMRPAAIRRSPDSQ